MREPPSNVGMVCSTHAPCPNPELAKLSPEEFVGHFVKKTFNGVHPVTGKETPEHMWVLVHRVVDGELEGELNNDPICGMAIKCGDTVRVMLSEIEDFIPTEPPAA